MGISFQRKVLACFMNDPIIIESYGIDAKFMNYPIWINLYIITRNYIAYETE